MESKKSCSNQKLHEWKNTRSNEMSLSEALVRKLTLDKSVQLELRKQMEENEQNHAIKSSCEMQQQIPKLIVTLTDGASFPVDSNLLPSSWDLDSSLDDTVDGVEDRDEAKKIHFESAFQRSELKQNFMNKIMQESFGERLKVCGFFNLQLVM